MNINKTNTLIAKKQVGWRGEDAMQRGSDLCGPDEMIRV